MKYNERLKELREDKDMTQEQLGKIFNCNQITISQYERGVRTLSIEMLIKYADYFEVTTDYILCRKTDNKRNGNINIKGNKKIGKITIK